MSSPWNCPFCPLHCEDLTVEWQNEGKGIVTPECWLAQRAVDRIDLQRIEPLPAMIRGEPVDRQEAIRSAAKMLDEAGFIAIRGSLSGLKDARSLLGFAERYGAAIDHDGTISQQAWRAAAARDGYFSATLGDIRRHADLVLFIGDPESFYPRLTERFLNDGLVAGRTRRVVRVDATASASAQTTKSGLGSDPQAGERLEVAENQTSEFWSLVRRRLGSPSAPAGGPVDPALTASLEQLTQWLDAANYVAVLLGPHAFDRFGGLGAEVESAELIASVAALNAERRAVLLSIDGSQSFRQAALWRTGFSGPLGWSQGVPGSLERGWFESRWNSLETLRLRVLESPAVEADPPLGSSASHANHERPPTQILLAAEGTSETERDQAELFLPITGPGVDRAEAVVRGDGSVTLALSPLRHGDDPWKRDHGLAETLAAIASASRWGASAAEER